MSKCSKCFFHRSEYMSNECKYFDMENYSEPEECKAFSTDGYLPKEVEIEIYKETDGAFGLKADEDLISRRKAFTAIFDACSKSGLASLAIPEWHTEEPCESDDYLCCCYDPYEDEYYYEVCTYYDTDGTAEGDYAGWRSTGRVVRWMRLPAVQEDLVYRNDVSKVIESEKHLAEIAFSMKAAIDSIPSAQKTGRWVCEDVKVLDDETDDGPVYSIKKRWKCSECGYSKGFSRYQPTDKYCSECGVKMLFDVKKGIY